MPTYSVNRSSSSTPMPGENWPIWFSGKGIEGRSNALMLPGSGEIHLLKTVKVVGRAELEELDVEQSTNEDSERWKDIFGETAASTELRDEYRRFRKVNNRL